MDYCFVSHAPQLHQQPPHLPLGHADLFGRLLLRDQFLLRLLQRCQPVSLGLRYE
jgi:hypothetical protein